MKECCSFKGPPPDQKNTLTDLDPVFDSYCIYLIENTVPTQETAGVKDFSHSGNAEKMNQQLSIMDTEWHHRTGNGPHTWINANKKTCTIKRHLRNLQSICRLNSGPLAWCPAAALWSALSLLLCPPMETRQPDKTQDWPAAACAPVRL